MIVVDTQESEVRIETLKDFIKDNGNVTMTTDDDICDIHLLRDTWFVRLNGQIILDRKTFKAVWNWIDSTNTEWQVQDEL